MKRTRTSSSSLSSSKQQSVASYLPDDCWEFIFKFIIDEEDIKIIEDADNRIINDKDNRIIKLSYINSLSLVSKQFLSITNRLRLSITISDSKHVRRIFKRFTNLNSLQLARKCIDSDTLLHKISRLQLKLKQQLRSLSLSNQSRIPTNGLRAFSQNMTNLTSLNCSHIRYLNTSDLFLIAECFPLLEELDLSHTFFGKNSTSYVDGVEALSLALIKLRKVNLSAFPINDQSLFHLFNKGKYLEEVIMFWCYEITDIGLASALRERPTLRYLSFSNPNVNLFATSHFIDSLMSLKGLTRLVLRCTNISDELLYSIATEGLPLTTLDLRSCGGYSYEGYSYAGIFRLLSKCQRIQHLNLKGADYLNDQHVVRLSSFLGDLVSINLSDFREITYSTLFALAKNCSSLSEIKMERIGTYIVGNSDYIREFGIYPQLKALYLSGNSWLSDEIIIMVASIFPNLLLLHLNSCDRISEGICQVLRKCCKLRHLNLSHCSRVKLLGMNFVVPNLEVLDLSCTKVDDETLYVISKNCRGLMKLLLIHCNGVTENGVTCVLKNCRQLRVRRCIISN